MKDDEKRFLVDVYKKCSKLVTGEVFGEKITYHEKTPRDIINEPNFYMHYKRAWYLLEKWCNKGWYDYGVTLDLGWLTPEGEKKAKEIMLKAEKESENNG